ncbi:MAG: hypothetical protein R6U85_05010, partial [Salinivirgaceae bacterium]
DWSLKDGYTANLEKTGTVDPIDYTNAEMALRGGAIMVADTAWGWSTNYMPHTPVVDGTNYTYTWENVTLKKDEGFKIVQVDPEQWFGAGDVEITGATSLLGGDDNITVTSDADEVVVNLELLIKSAEFKKEFKVTLVE